MRAITILRSIGFAVLLAAAVQAEAGITYQLRTERRGRTTTATVWAEGSSYRVETRASEDMDEMQRQYPIVISTDGGRTQRHLRPAGHGPCGRAERDAGTAARSRIVRAVASSVCEWGTASDGRSC